MATRKRDYKAEYRRRKEIAQSAGYTSVRSYKTERQRLSLPRTASLASFSVRKANRDWSNTHSRLPTSEWFPDFDSEQDDLYYQAFVRQYDNPAEKLEAIHEYLFTYDLVTEEEWQQNYGLASA